MNKILISIGLVIIFFLLTPLAPSMAIMLSMDTAELTKRSSLVVVGEVMDIESEWKGDMIITLATLKVLQVVKGQIEKSVVTVEYKGGEVGDTKLVVSDVKIPAAGEKLLLFLKRSIGDKYEVVGKAQGQYSIDKKTGLAKKGEYSVLNATSPETKGMKVDALIRSIKDEAIDD